MADSASNTHMVKFCRFSMRSLLFTVTGIAVSIGFWAERGRRQKVAVDSLRHLGSFVVYDYYHEFIGFEGRRLFDRREPSSLSQFFEVDFCHSAIEVQIPPRIPLNEALRLLRRLPRLRTVSFSMTKGFGEDK